PATASPGVLTLNGSAGVGLGLVSGTLTGQVTASGGTQADAVAASQANGQSSILSETLPTNKLGYGSAEVTQNGLISANLNLIGLLNIPLVEATPVGNSTPDRSTVSQTGTLAAPSQAFTASASKNFTEVDVLRTVLGGVVKLSGYKASASACASPTSALCPASTALEQGTLTILGTTYNLQGHASGSLGVQNTTVALGLATLTIGANATIGSSTATSPGSGQVTSPLKIHVTLQISTVLTGTLVNLSLDVDLGDVVTGATYQ
ncbi:MAG: hypothetical protein M3N98_08825, partial [Actinomycetota bacterium]|nr:hypothetical protein [Actinomycetota bacterium]